MKRCSYYFDLEDVMKDRAGTKPPFSSDQGMDELLNESDISDDDVVAAINCATEETPVSSKRPRLVQNLDGSNRPLFSSPPSASRNVCSGTPTGNSPNDSYTDWNGKF